MAYLVFSKKQSKTKQKAVMEPENRLNSMNTASEAKKLQLMLNLWRCVFASCLTIFLHSIPINT